MTHLDTRPRQVCCWGWGRRAEQWGLSWSSLSENVISSHHSHHFPIPTKHGNFDNNWSQQNEAFPLVTFICWVVYSNHVKWSAPSKMLVQCSAVLMQAPDSDWTPTLRDKSSTTSYLIVVGNLPPPAASLHPDYLRSSCRKISGGLLAQVALLPFLGRRSAQS